MSLFPRVTPDMTAGATARVRHRRLRSALFAMALLDELSGGLLVVALPLVRDRLHLSYAQAGLLFTTGALSSMLLEPVINFLSDLGSKRIPILLGALTLAVSFVLAGAASNYALELVAFALWSPAVGTAVGLSQATLIDSWSQSSERTMMRWTLMSGIGDLLAPILVGLAVGFGLGWSALCGFAAAIWLLILPVIGWQDFPQHASHDTDEPAARTGMLVSLHEALHDATLLRWTGIVLLAAMPDEVFLAFAALFLHDHLHTPENIASFVLALGIAGGLLTLFVLDRLGGRVDGVKLLPWLAVIALMGFLLLLAAPNIILAALGLTVANIGAAGWYPIAKAAAYTTRPGRPGLVRAVESLGMPFEIALPGFIGLLATHFGLASGIGFLALAPLGVLLLLPPKFLRGTLIRR